MNSNKLEYRLILDLLKGGSVESAKNIFIVDFTKLLNRHKLLPLAKEIIEVVEPKDKYKLKDRLGSWAIRSTLLSQELISIIRELKSHNVEGISLKGPLLATQFYDDHSQRFFSDLDVMVKDADLFQLIKVLSSLGYSLSISGNRIYDQNIVKQISKRREFEFFNEQKKVLLEIPLGVHDELLLNSKKGSILIQNTKTLSFGGQKISVLNDEENFVYLCYHASKHSFYRFCWLKDIASALEKWELNQDQVRGLIHELGLERVIGISMALVERYFDIQAPSAFGSYMQNRPWLWLLKWMHGRIIRGPGKKKAKEVFKIRTLLKFNRRVEDQVVISWFLIYLFRLFLRPGLKYKIDCIIILLKSGRTNRRLRRLVMQN